MGDTYIFIYHIVNIKPSIVGEPSNPVSDLYTT